MSGTDISNKARSEAWDPKIIPDQSGKVALITGAYSEESIGYNVALQLALKGATVFLGARSQQKAQSGVNDMTQTHPQLRGRVFPFIADIGDLKQTQSAALQFLDTQPRLDILVNNAAMLSKKWELDQYGISDVFTTNHLGTMVLTTTLLPLLKKTAALPHSDVRIVTLSSLASNWLDNEAVSFESRESFNKLWGAEDDKTIPGSNLLRYGYSKLANVLMGKELQKQFDTERVNIITLSLHPGSVATTGVKGFAVNDEFRKLLEGFITPAQGALTALFAATSPEVTGNKVKFAGSFLMPFGVVSPSDLGKHAEDPALPGQLWTTSDKVINEILSK